MSRFEYEQSLTVKKISSIQNIDCELSSSNNVFDKELNIGKGDKGDRGEDGYTPKKGIDYFTREDIESLKEIFSQVEHTHYNKIDNVELDGFVLNFYAEGKIVKSIEISKRTVAICGEFLSGEVFVGEGVENSTSRNQPKWVDGVTPVNAKNMNEIEDKLKAHQEALDELLYVPLTINLTSNTQTALEIGTTISSVVFNWTYSKQVISQSFNGTSLDKSIRTYTYNSSFNSNKTFTLNANDGTKNFSKSIGFSFLNGRYWGVSSAMSYDNDLIRNFSKELSSSKSKTFTVNCGKGQHIFYCVPTRFGSCSFKVGGFEGGFNKVSTIQYTNSSGYTENYDVYKSSNSNLGNTTVVVS